MNTRNENIEKCKVLWEIGLGQQARRIYACCLTRSPLFYNLPFITTAILLTGNFT